jgi:hypothetical protein
MISCHLMGGLGNYLFQIAAGYSKSLDLGEKFVINPNNVQVVHKPLTFYTDNILKKITLDSNFNTNQVYYEPVFHYSPIPDFMLPTYLHGYFQSEKYFKNNREKILEFFTCNEVVDKIREKYKNELNVETCSIHVRRGDFLTLQDHHPTQDMEYYKKAISIVGSDKTFFMFSDDISWCKENFKFLDNVIYCENNEDYEDLYLMSLCRNNIIANSSFSWWGAWLNQNENKITVGPKKWFGPSKSNFITDDIYCEKWIVI